MEVRLASVHRASTIGMDRQRAAAARRRTDRRWVQRMAVFRKQRSRPPVEPPPTEALFASGALLALGREREALELLERTRPRGAQLWFYLRNPEFHSLRTNPRFMRIEKDADPRES